MDRLRSLSDRTLVLMAALVVVLPLVVALAALAQRRWYPVLDLAMTEFRVSDVGTRETPLIGLPGRIGDLPDQGSHPGPISFWLLAPTYAVFGRTPWAMEVGTVVIALGWTVAALWIGHRRLGRAGVAIVAFVIAVMIRGFGLSVMTQPWNPYMPLLAWLVVLLAAWAVFDGDDLMLIPLAVAASFGAQTHIPYLLMAGGIGLVAVGVSAVRWARHRGGHGNSRRSLTITIAVFVGLWLAPLVDQLRRDPGNITRLLDHFGAPDDEPIGWVEGVALMLRHLDVVGAHLRLFTGQERFLESGFDPDSSVWPGIVVLVLWVVAAVAAIRLRHHSLISLHAVLAVTLVLSSVSMARIFGQRWYYLTLWAWVTTTLIIVAIGWTALALARRRRPSAETFLPNGRIAAILGGSAIVVTASMAVVAPSTDHPEEDVGDVVGALLDPTAAALDAEQIYEIEWQDAYFFGSQAFGLMNELRRDGFDVRAGEFWQVPVTRSRTVARGEADESIVFVTGGFVDEWRSDERFREVATVDLRTDPERSLFDALTDELVADLETTGLVDLVPAVDTNLFGLNIDQRISARAREISAELISLGQETAVFVGPTAAER
jgi:hypothetical protein